MDSGAANNWPGAVVLLHGGPGLPDYLGQVAAMIDDLTVVHRYDQRGVGGSPWEGHHTLDRHLHDLDDLLDGWGHDRVAIVGHSYGTDLAARYCLRRTNRIAGMVLLAGPFVGPWRNLDRSERQARMTAAQRARLADLDAAEHRTAEPSSAKRYCSLQQTRGSRTTECIYPCPSHQRSFVRRPARKVQRDGPRPPVASRWP